MLRGEVNTWSIRQHPSDLWIENVNDLKLFISLAERIQILETRNVIETAGNVFEIWNKNLKKIQ